MTLTTTSSAATSSSKAVSDKDWTDFLGGILPDVVQTVAPEFGIDPSVAGQTISSVLDIFGIGGSGKAFTPAVPKDQALAHARQILEPHLSDPAFAIGIKHWLRAALEPVQAHKDGKAYLPPAESPAKGWFDDFVSTVSDAASSVAGTVSDAVSNVNWQQVGQQVAQVGMQVLPYVLA